MLTPLCLANWRYLMVLTGCAYTILEGSTPSERTFLISCIEAQSKFTPERARRVRIMGSSLHFTAEDKIENDSQFPEKSTRSILETRCDLISRQRTREKLTVKWLDPWAGLLPEVDFVENILQIDDIETSGVALWLRVSDFSRVVAHIRRARDAVKSHCSGNGFVFCQINLGAHWKSKSS